MGIQGVWSFVFKDPRRFGVSWVCFNECVIWIHSPSLLYYLALQLKFKTIGTFDCHHNQIEQASLADIYKRTLNFITVLQKLAKEIHIVMDGLCQETKIATQIKRAKVAAQQANEVTQTGGLSRNRKVIRILAEWCIIEAIEKMKCYVPSLYFHMPSKMEAKTLSMHLSATKKMTLL